MPNTLNINLIPYGRDNRISRKELMEKTGLDTKEFNLQLVELRKDYIIMSDQSTGAYWRCNNKEEMQEFIKKLQLKEFTNSKAIMLAYKEMEEM